MKTYRLELFICLFLIVATLAVYWQVSDHGFISLDDGNYVTQNREVQAGLSQDAIIWSFKAFHALNWHPLTWLSHMLDCDLFGLNAGRHHLINLLFHIANTLLLFLVLGRMTGALWRSGFVAALFALHPLHVESVAWVSERKDVLSTFFWMLTMWAYVRYVERPKASWYFMVLIFFVLGLMAKPMVVTLPFVLLLMDYWPLRRLESGQSAGESNKRSQRATLSRLILEKLPLLVLTASSSVVTFFAQQEGVQSIDALPLSNRISNIFIAYVTYMGKMFWPQDLAVFYPFPTTMPMWQVTGAILLLICFSAMVIKMARQRPYLAVGWLWYLGTLIPVIGLVQVGGQSMADRYTYIPLIGLFMMVAWGVPGILGNWRFRQIGFAISMGLVLSAFIVCTWFQVGHWKDGTVLFRHALNVTANNYVAHNSLGIALHEQERSKEGIRHFLKAIRIKRDYADAYHNLGNALMIQGNLKGAIRCFKEALKIKPYRADGHYSLGNVFLQQGNFKDAIRSYSEALSIRPNFPGAQDNLKVALGRMGKQGDAIRHYLEVLQKDLNNAEAHNNLARALETQGRLEEAIRHYKAAVRINPDDAVLHDNLGVALAQAGRLKEAISHYSTALQLKPDLASAHNNIGSALEQQARSMDAIKHYKEAIRIDPDDANAHYNLGTVLARQGIYEEATTYYLQALGIKPDFADAHNNLGIVLARQGNLKEAIRHYSESLRIDPDSAKVHFNLAVALERQGGLKEAIGHYSESLRIDPDLEVARRRIEIISQRMLKSKRTFNTQ